MDHLTSPETEESRVKNQKPVPDEKSKRVLKTLTLILFIGSAALYFSVFTLGYFTPEKAGYFIGAWSFCLLLLIVLHFLLKRKLQDDYSKNRGKFIIVFILAIFLIFWNFHSTLVRFNKHYVEQERAYEDTKKIVQSIRLDEEIREVVIDEQNVLKNPQSEVGKILY